MSEINNITVYTTGSFPYGGAAENFVRLMVIGLIKNGQDVDVKLFRGQSADSENNIKNVKVSSLLFKYRQRKEFLKFIEFCLLICIIPFSVIQDKVLNKKNTIILYGIDYFYFVFPFWIVSKLLNIKLIRIVTDKYENSTIVPVWWKIPKLYFYQLQCNFFDKYLNGLVFLSSFLLNEFLKNGGNNTKAILIPHFIDIEQFKIARNCNKDNIIIGYCGTIILNNGIFDLLDAYKLLLKWNSNNKLLIIGSADDLINSDYEKFVNIITDLSENIIWKKNVVYQEVALKLRQCSILVNPRRKGKWADAGFPTKLGEYLACEKIVITTKVADISNYFTDGKELFITEPNNPFELFEKLKFIIENIGDLNSVATDGLAWVKENLQFEKSSLKLTQFIDNIL